MYTSTSQDSKIFEVPKQNDENRRQYRPPYRSILDFVLCNVILIACAETLVRGLAVNKPVFEAITTRSLIDDPLGLEDWI